MAAQETKSPKTKAATDTVAAKAKSLFKDYPTVNTFYFTSDGTAFIQECDAHTHAVTLKDSAVKTIKRK